jgi:trimethylamine:corrinoid methyltransferase-like protein
MKINSWFDQIRKLLVESNDIDELCRLSVRMLNEIGIELENDRILQICSKANHLKVKNNRIYFDKKYTENLINEDRQQKELQSKELNQPREFDLEPEYSLSNGGFGFLTIDQNTRSLRSATLDDLIKFTKLSHAAGCSGPNPVFAQNLPEKMRDIATYRYCYEYSDRILGRYYSTLEQAKYIYEMSCASGFPFRVTVSFDKALSVNKYDLETLMYFLENDKKFRISTVAYHLPGITGPVTVAGCQALQLAEHLGAFIIYRHLADNYETNGFSLGQAGPVDFKNACWAYGCSRTIAYLTFSIYMNQLYRKSSFFNLPAVTLMTGSCCVDSQAAIDKTAVAVSGALMGCKTFGCLGSLAVDDVFSPEQFVIDLEIVNYVKNQINSADTIPKNALLEDVFEDVKANAFDDNDWLMSEGTISKFKDFTNFESLLKYNKALSSAAEDDLLSRATSGVEQLLKNYNYECDADKLKEVDKKYQSAYKKLA